MGVPSFQFAERLSHMLQRSGAGDRHLQLPARGNPGRLAEHDRARRRTFSVGSPPTLAAACQSLIVLIRSGRTPNSTAGST
ncbi:hypothetical protein ACFRH4_41000 [Streptomyces mirabilis]|uniref:hypothetical protein n=1 Tax=Streptomyces mirabilis TaxID=68239 RepID=UPI0036C67FF7